MSVEMKRLFSRSERLLENTLKFSGKAKGKSVVDGHFDGKVKEEHFSKVNSMKKKKR